MHSNLHQQRSDDQQPKPPKRDAAVPDDARRTPAMSADDEAQFKSTYRDALYYSSGRDWDDYAPAYHYGHAARARHRGQRFEDVEEQLAAGWDACKADSRLLWVEARGAVLDAWQHFDVGTTGAEPRRRGD
jgi:hypothetical protein